MAISENFTNYEKESIDSFVERSYEDYALYVISDRAIPFIGDGLKPVQRRIIYAMFQLGLKPGSKHKKSARTVGDVLGKYHPHGDTACYEAMVLMAQPFSFRYPMVDGQGNWGAPDDPKSFAAMRYTESRLHKNAMHLLDEVPQGANEWVQNYDGTTSEPVTLPSKIPSILLVGVTGIAVGIATDIPPHNLYESYQAIKYLAKHPNASIDKLMEFIPGPDQPTGAEIVSSRDELKAMYTKGRGSYRARAIYELEDEHIAVKALPFRVSPDKIMESIGELMRAKKVPLIEDIRDDSDHETPVRLLISFKCKRGENRAEVADKLMEHLFANTDLETSFRVNMNVLGMNGRPDLLSLRDVLLDWMAFRKITIKRRVEHRLQKIHDRLHIIDGLMVAYLNIDEVIRIIREEDDPKAELMARFKLSDVQAVAILDLRLRHLGRLEEDTLNAEKSELEKEQVELNAIIETDESLQGQMVEELAEIAKSEKNTRLSPIVEREKAVGISEADMIPAEDITVILSKEGWIRSARGHTADATTLNYKGYDGLFKAIKCRSTDTLAVVDTSGRLFNISAGNLPSSRGQGEPISSKITLAAGESIDQIFKIDKDKEYLLATTIGNGFICKGEDLFNNQKKGRAFISLAGGKLLPIQAVNDGSTHVVCMSEDQYVIAIALNDVHRLNKGKGSRLQQVSKSALLTLNTINAELPVEVAGLKRKTRLEAEVVQNMIMPRGRRGKALKVSVAGINYIGHPQENFDGEP